jgi:hypothetical protein
MLITDRAWVADPKVPSFDSGATGRDLEGRGAQNGEAEGSLH